MQPRRSRHVAALAFESCRPSLAVTFPAPRNFPSAFRGADVPFVSRPCCGFHGASPCASCSLMPLLLCCSRRFWPRASSGPWARWFSPWYASLLASSPPCVSVLHHRSIGSCCWLAVLVSRRCLLQLALLRVSRFDRSPLRLTSMLTVSPGTRAHTPSRGRC